MSKGDKGMEDKGMELGSEDEGLGEAGQKDWPQKVSFNMGSISDDPLETLELRKFEREVSLLLSRGSAKAPERSEFWHQLIRWGLLCWKNSPYVVLHSKQYIFIASDFTVFYWTQEALRANIELDRVAFAIRMKEAMRTAYGEQYSKDSEGFESFDEYLRSRWLISYFEVCSAEEELQEGRLRKYFSDESGTSEKAPEIRLGEGRIPAGSEFNREMLIVLRDYIQFRGEGAGVSETTDRVGVSIDMPMRDLDLTLILDSRLYGKGKPPEDLVLQLRNLEEVAFRQEAIPLLREFKSFSALPIPRDSLGSARHLHYAMIERIGELEGQEQLLRGRHRCFPEFPSEEHCLGFRVSWAWPHYPVEVCISWKKPIRPAP